MFRNSDPCGASAAAARRIHSPRPLEILTARNRVVVAAVLDSEVIGRRRDHDVDGAVWDPGEHVEAVAEIEAKCRASGLDGCVGRREAGTAAIVPPGYNRSCQDALAVRG